MFFALVPSPDNQLAVAVAEVRLVGVEEGAQRSDVRGVRDLHFSVRFRVRVRVRVRVTVTVAVRSSEP